MVSAKQSPRSNQWPLGKPAPQAKVEKRSHDPQYQTRKENKERPLQRHLADEVAALGRTAKILTVVRERDEPHGDARTTTSDDQAQERADAESRSRRTEETRHRHRPSRHVLRPSPRETAVRARPPLADGRRSAASCREREARLADDDRRFGDFYLRADRGVQPLAIVCAPSGCTYARATPTTHGSRVAPRRARHRSRRPGPPTWVGDGIVAGCMADPAFRRCAPGNRLLASRDEVDPQRRTVMSVTYPLTATARSDAAVSSVDIPQLRIRRDLGRLVGRRAPDGSARLASSCPCSPIGSPAMATCRWRRR